MTEFGKVWLRIPLTGVAVTEALNKSNVHMSRTKSILFNMTPSRGRPTLKDENTLLIVLDFITMKMTIYLAKNDFNSPFG